MTQIYDKERNAKTDFKRQVSLKDFDNSEYYPGAGKIKRLVWYFVNAFIFNTWLLPVSKIKIFLLKAFGAKVGTGVIIKPRVNIKYPWNLAIGDYCWVGEGVWIDNLADVTIESDVCLSQNSYLLTGNHNYKMRTFDLITGPIKIEHGAWIGAFSVVCPNVTIGEYSVVSVGSVITVDTQSNYIYQGNPGKKIRLRFRQDGI